MYNFGSRKCRNDLNEVPNLNIYFSQLFLVCTSFRSFLHFRLPKLYICQELVPLNVDSRAAFHKKYSFKLEKYSFKLEKCNFNKLCMTGL
jgi:hypothetical protein